MYALAAGGASHDWGADIVGNVNIDGDLDVSGTINGTIFPLICELFRNDSLDELGEGDVIVLSGNPSNEMKGKNEPICKVKLCDKEYDTAAVGIKIKDRGAVISTENKDIIRENFIKQRKKEGKEIPIKLEDIEINEVEIGEELKGQTYSSREEKEETKERFIRARKREEFEKQRKAQKKKVKKRNHLGKLEEVETTDFNEAFNKFINDNYSITKPQEKFGAGVMGPYYKCRATNYNGKLKPGDLLTTSSKKGHAMKVTDKLKAIGAIIGKCLDYFDEESGYVKIMITLQ